MLPKQAPKTQGFRHTTSLILLAGGIIAAGVAIPIGLQAQQSAMLSSQSNTEMEKGAEDAQGKATITTALWITSAALLSGGVIAMIIELVTQPKVTSLARLPAPSSPVMTLLSVE